MLSTTPPPRWPPPPQAKSTEVWDSPALSRLAAGPVLGAAALLADGFSSSSVEERGKVRQPPAGFLSFPPFVRTRLPQPTAEALKVSHIPDIPRAKKKKPASFQRVSAEPSGLFVYLSCSSPSGWSSPPCTLCSPAGRTRSGRSSRRGGGTLCCTWGRSSARHSAP